MDSKELYTVLLGVRAPWTVTAVQMSVPRPEAVVQATHPAGTRFRCPQCERELSVFDHRAKRRWRHLDSCQFLTYLQARPPRVHCPEHGKHAVALPWAEGASRFTTMFEALAVEVLLAAYYEEFCPAQRAGIKAVSIDMWTPYTLATQAAVPGAEDKIVFDRFHIMQHVNEALDRVRRQENKALRAVGDDTLVRSKYLWLQGAHGMSEEAQQRITPLMGSILRTARAWAAPSGQRACLLHASHHQRGRRGAELQDRHDPEARLRLSQPRPLQDRRVLPLRRPAARPSKGNPHEGLKDLDWLGDVCC